MARLLGIDYGEKRVGVAISDEERKMAFPKYVLQNDDRLVEKIGKVCVDEGIEEVVLGRSMDYKNHPNTIMEKIEALKKALKKEKDLTVHLEDEFLTTAEAKRIQGETDDIDASAAALILKSFMDREKNG